MLRFAGDIVLLAKSESELEEIVNGLSTLLRNDFNLKINKIKEK